MVKNVIRYIYDIFNIIIYVYKLINNSYNYVCIWKGDYMKPLIGIVSKPYKGNIWNYIQAVDEIREVLVDNGARVISIIPQGISIDSNYDNYPNYENYDLF